MCNKKNILVAVIIFLLMLSALTFSGCLFGDDNATVPIDALQGSAITRQQSGAVGFSPGAWLAQAAVDQIGGSLANKGVNSLVSMIFGSPSDPTGQKLNEILDEIKAVDLKIDMVISQLGLIQVQLSSIDASIHVGFLDLDASISQKFTSDAISGIKTLWDIYTGALRRKADAARTPAEIVALQNDYYAFALKVEPEQGVPQTEKYVNDLSGLLLDEGGLLQLWTDKAITAYSRMPNKTSGNLIDGYNYIETNFQKALLYQAKAATMIITALQAIEEKNKKDGKSTLQTASDYRITFKSLLTEQARQFRNQTERYVLTCSNIKTAKSGNFLPEGFDTIFNRADYLYLMLAGETENGVKLQDANGKPVYGIFGRVISPFALSADAARLSGGGDIGELNPAESVSYDSFAVANSAIVPREIDSWQTSFSSGGVPVSKLSFSNKWYVYRYYKGPLTNVGTVNLAIQNEIKNTVPVCYNNANVKEYDEAAFDVPAAGVSRVVKYGDFTITAGYAGNSVFFASPVDSPKPYIWQPFFYSEGTTWNAGSYADSSNNSPQRFGSNVANVSRGEMEYTRRYQIGMLRKTIEYTGTAAKKMNLHVNLNVNGNNFFNHGGDAQINNFVGIKIFETASRDFAFSPALYDGSMQADRRVQRHFDDRQVSIDANIQNGNGSSNFSEPNFTRDISVTFQPNKFYHIYLFATSYATANGFYTMTWGRVSRYGTTYNVSASGELNELYLTASK